MACWSFLTGEAGVSY